MIMKMPKFYTPIFLFLLSAVLVSCGTGSDTASLDANQQTGRVSLLITDGPTDEFDQVNVTIESISFIREDDDDHDDDSNDDHSNNDDSSSDHSSSDDGDDAKSDDDDDNSHETIVFDQSEVINLLALENYSELLSTAVIPAGNYSKIRLHVSQVELVKLDAEGKDIESHIAKLPANGKIDLNPRESFEVTGGGHQIIELDIDANKSILIIEKGNGKLSYNFRPVVFINVLGEEELKLVMLDGVVFEKSDTGFLLCDGSLLEPDDSCFNIQASAQTVTQDDQIDVVIFDSIEDGDVVTVLGKAGVANVAALHVVIYADATEPQNLAVFSGDATSMVDASNVFTMVTDDDNDVVAPDTSLNVLLTDGARIFDKYGNVVSSDVLHDGVDVDVFGLAVPELAAVTDVDAAFVIYDEDEKDDKFSGIIAAIDTIDGQITVSVDKGAFSGDVCFDIDEAHMFKLTEVDDKIRSDEIAMDDLAVGMSVDVYGEDEGHSCISADVVLVTGI